MVASQKDAFCLRKSLQEIHGILQKTRAEATGGSPAGFVGGIGV